MRTRLIFISLFIGAVLLRAGGVPAEGLATQSSSGSGVTVSVTPRNLNDGSWEFKIALNTHSQDLADDLMKSASLVANDKTMAPAGWTGSPAGGHHRKGVLRFGAIVPAPKNIELNIARPGEPKPRTFRWQLK